MIEIELGLLKTTNINSFDIQINNNNFDIIVIV